MLLSWFIPLISSTSLFICRARASSFQTHPTPRTIGLLAPARVDVYRPPRLPTNVILEDPDGNNSARDIGAFRDRSAFNVLSAGEEDDEDGAQGATIGKRTRPAGHREMSMWFDMIPTGETSTQRIKLIFRRVDSVLVNNWRQFVLIYAQRVMLAVLMQDWAHNTPFTAGTRGFRGSKVIWRGMYGWEILCQSAMTSSHIPWNALREVLGWIFYGGDRFFGWSSIHVEIVMTGAGYHGFRSVGSIEVRQDVPLLLRDLLSDPIRSGQVVINAEWAAMILRQLAGEETAHRSFRTEQGQIEGPNIPEPTGPGQGFCSSSRGNPPGSHVCSSSEAGPSNSRAGASGTLSYWPFYAIPGPLGSGSGTSGSQDAASGSQDTAVGSHVGPSGSQVVNWGHGSFLEASQPTPEAGLSSLEGASNPEDPDMEEFWSAFTAFMMEGHEGES